MLSGLKPKVLIAFEPIYYMSKLHGTLPLSYVKRDTLLKYKFRSIINAISIFVLFTFEFYNIYDSYNYSTKIFKNITLKRILRYIGIITLELKFITVLIFIIFEVKKLPKIFEILCKVDKILQLKDFHQTSIIFLCHVLVFQGLCSYLNISYLVESEPISAVTGFLMETALISLELQMWSIIYLTRSKFQALNKKLESAIKNEKFIPGINFIQLRHVYGELVDLTDQINSIYNLNILFVLCLHNIFLQYEMYSEFQVIYDLMYGYDKGFSINGIKWALLDITKISYLFYICIESEDEMSFMII